MTDFICVYVNKDDNACKQVQMKLWEEKIHPNPISAWMVFQKPWVRIPVESDIFSPPITQW